MAYHARKEGQDAFKLQRTRSDCMCFVCEDIITAGSERYKSEARLNLCTECMNEWMRVGGKLGAISRNKHRENF